jgi:iron complex outermembrane receptor protein
MIYVFSPALLKKITLIVSILLLPTAFVWSQSELANDTLKIDRLLDLSFEELMNVMVITPTQGSLRANNAPASVKVVTQEQIQLRGYHNLAEVLNDLADITVQDKTDPQHYNRVSIRGVSRQDFFIIMLDGVRISSPTNEPLPILENFPIYFAKQIEIVYGPGSALYGADAMAGVVNIITRKPGDAGSPTVAASVIGGSNGYSNASVVIQKKMENDFKLSLAGLYSYDAQPDFSKVYKDQFSMTSHQTGVWCHYATTTSTASL